jgi:nitrile hydratase accessory protein
MLTSYEHYALTEMLGAPDSPPRHNGHLCFGQAWERQAFGMALALSKAGFFEWDVFRDELIAAIQAWEQSHRLDDPSWDYYECWLAALEKAVLVAGLITPAELAGLYGPAERPGHGGSRDDGAP